MQLPSSTGSKGRTQPTGSQTWRSVTLSCPGFFTDASKASCSSMQGRSSKRLRLEAAEAVVIMLRSSL